MSLRVQVVGGRVISGVSKESGNNYEFTALAVVTQGDRGAIVGEIVLDGSSIPAAGAYDVVLEPRVRAGRISYSVVKLLPVTKA